MAGGSGVEGRGVKVGVAWLTGVSVADKVMDVGVGMEVEILAEVGGAGVDWQAVSTSIMIAKA